MPAIEHEILAAVRDRVNAPAGGFLPRPGPRDSGSGRRRLALVLRSRVSGLPRDRNLELDLDLDLDLDLEPDLEPELELELR